MSEWRRLSVFRVVCGVCTAWLYLPSQQTPRLHGRTLHRYDIPLTQQLWFLTKGGITSLYHTGHFTQAISVARSYTVDCKCSSQRRVALLHYTTPDILPKFLHCWLSKCRSERRTPLPHYTTQDIYRGYISGKILHCWLQMWFRTKGGITSLYHTGHFTQVTWRDLILLESAV